MHRHTLPTINTITHTEWDKLSCDDHVIQGYGYYPARANIESWRFSICSVVAADANSFSQ